MSWIVLDYNWAVKPHIVHDSVAEIVKRDIDFKHNCITVGEKTIPELHIDPGGMIFMESKIKKLSLSDGNIVSIRPELILNALIVWGRHRFLDEALPSGERIVKVYSTSNLIVVPESIYNKIGAWLVLSKAEGYTARMEIVEALSGVPGIIVTPPKSEGEA